MPNHEAGCASTDPQHIEPTAPLGNPTSPFVPTEGACSLSSLRDLEEAKRLLSSEARLRGLGSLATAHSSQPHWPKSSGPSRTPLLSPEVAATVESRSMKYGEPIQFYASLARMWHAILTQATGVKMPLDTSTVCLMMAALKILRASHRWHDDNYVDAAAFLSFAQQAQSNEATS